MSQSDVPDSKVVPLSLHSLPPSYKTKMMIARGERNALAVKAEEARATLREMNAILSDILTWSDVVCATIGNRMEYAGVEEITGDISCSRDPSLSEISDVVRRRLGYMFINVNQLAIEHHTMSEHLEDLSQTIQQTEYVYTGIGEGVPGAMSFADVIDHLQETADPVNKLPVRTDSSLLRRVESDRPSGSLYVEEVLSRGTSLQFGRPPLPRRVRRDSDLEEVEEGALTRMSTSDRYQHEGYERFSLAD